MGGTISCGPPEGPQRALRPRGPPAQPPASTSSPGWPSTPVAATCAPTAHPSRRRRGGDRPHQQGDRRYLVGTGPAADRRHAPLQRWPRRQDHRHRLQLLRRGHPLGHGLSRRGELSGQRRRVPHRGRDCSQRGKITWPARLRRPGQLDRPRSGAARSTSTRPVPSSARSARSTAGWWRSTRTIPSSRAKKHTALGRFRHENIAVRAEEGNHLVCYTGDDRRGGHFWKFVSRRALSRTAKDSPTRDLFEEGTLHVARFNAGATSGTGDGFHSCSAHRLQSDRPVRAGGRRGGRHRTSGGDHGRPQRTQNPAAQARRRGVAANDRRRVFRRCHRHRE